jgi:hypothetical protein
MALPLNSNRIESINDTVDGNNHLDDGLNIGVDVISVALDAFTLAIIGKHLSHYNMAHYINVHAIIYDRFNKIVSLLFEVELYPSKQSRETLQYIAECIFSDENHTFVNYVATARGEKKMKPRSAERGASCDDNARDRYLCGITHLRILEHTLADGDEATSDPRTHEGKRFTSLYGVPWTLFVDLSNEYEQWCSTNVHTFNIKEECPFKLRVMASFRQLRTGGSLSQYREGYTIAGSVFRELFYLFLDWHWDILYIHIIVPETKEEIDHVENLYRLIGYPGCVGSVDCVHVPWGAYRWTLQTKCKNKQKQTPTTVVFEVVCSHTPRVLNVSEMFWGTCGDSRIVKYDTAVHEVMDGRFYVLPFELLDIIINTINIYGYYYICDGGYPKLKFLVCPFKWPQSGTDMELWSGAVESARKDIEWCFCSMKKRWRILVTPLTNREYFRVEQIFTACCVLYNILIAYNGGDNWHGRISIVQQNGEEEIAPVIIDNDHSFLPSQYRADPEFAATLQQNMETPSHEIRAFQRTYEICHSSQVEIVSRLNQSQAHYVRVKRMGRLMKLKKMKEHK